jgi:hypothetical protein
MRDMRYIILKDGRYGLLESSAFLRRDRMSWGRNETGGNEDGEIAGVGDVLLVGGEMEDWMRCLSTQ